MMLERYSSNAPDALSGAFELDGPPAKPDITLVGQPLITDKQREQLGHNSLSGVIDLMDLPGSYGAVIQESDGVSLIADITGQFRFYYTRKDQSICYSTSATALAEEGGLKINCLTLGGIILGYNELVPEATAYANIKQVPAGAAVHISKHGIRSAEYDSLAPNPAATYCDAVAQLRESLLEAIRLRIETSESLGGDFSGGFDSTSLSFIAASEMAEGDYLNVFHYTQGLAVSRDLEYAARYAALDKRLNLHRILGDAALLPFGGLEPAHILKSDQPSSILQASRVLRKIVSSVTRAGVTDRIIGEGADELLATGPSRARDMLGSLSLGQVVRAMQEGAMRSKTSLWKYSQVQLEMARTSFQESWHQLGDLLLDKREAAPVWHAVNPWDRVLLSQRLRKELADIAYERAGKSDVPGTMGVADFIARNQLRSVGKTTAAERAACQLLGLHELHAPFLDRRVVTACMQLPAYQRSSPGQYKPMLHHALQGIVPEEVFARETKGNYLEELYLGFIKNGSRLTQLLVDNSLLAQLDIIDPNVMKCLISEARLGKEAPYLAIVRAVSIELWLRSIHNHDAKPIDGLSAQKTLRKPTLQSSIQYKASVSDDQLRVPDEVRFLEDTAAVVAYNLLTSQHIALDPKASMVVKALQDRGSLADAFGALRQLYPQIHPDLLQKDLVSIVALLKSHDIFMPGEHRPFVVPRVFSGNDERTEIPMRRSPHNKDGIRFRDYARVGWAFRSAFALTRPTGTHPLYDTLMYLRDIKQDLFPSTAERVHRLLTVGHLLNRYIGKAACLEMTIAVVLAEARQGRRVDVAIGMGLLPRQFHAWPVVEGESVQTEYDQGKRATFTPFDIW